MLLFLIHNVQAAPIINGQYELGFPSAIAIGADFGSPFAICTANLITPRVVITAAHCSADLPVELVVSSGLAFFGSDVATASDRRGFEDMLIHPEYVELQSEWGGTLGAYDFALLTLDDDAPVEPTLFRIDPLTDAELNTTLTSVGYGLTDPNGQSNGVKFSAELTLDAYQEMFLISYSSTNPNNAQICSGDSGGPMFYYDAEIDQYIQWAVHSWGDGGCSQMSGSTRTDLISDWILDYVEDVHGTRDLCEANGWYSNDRCDTFCEEPDPDCSISEDNPEEESKSGCTTFPTGDLSLWLLPFIGILACRSRPLYSERDRLR